MTINDSGTFNPDPKEIILGSMMADAKQRFGSDLNDNEQAVIRRIYDPVAERLAEAQDDMAGVLASTQLRYATAGALDLFCEQLGLARLEAQPATGTARFSRATAASVDYTIPAGTDIQTDSNDPYTFSTTETATLIAGDTSVDVPIESEDGGVETNVGANTITTFSGTVTGIESVTNPASTTGGTNRELDDELRSRTRKELGAGSRASQPALIRAARRVDEVGSATIFANDQSVSTVVDGLEPHEVELVVEGGNPGEIAEALMEAKAAGDVLVGGVHGTAVNETVTLVNGQVKDVAYSNPDEIQIYVSADISTTDEYEGDGAVLDSIISYIGGTFTTGNKDGGELSVGDDVIYGEIEYAVRDVDGVFDVTSLSVGKTASPTGTSNITIQDFELAVTDGTDGSITVTIN